MPELIVALFPRARYRTTSGVPPVTSSRTPGSVRQPRRNLQIKFPRPGRSRSFSIAFVMIRSNSVGRRIQPYWRHGSLVQDGIEQVGARGSPEWQLAGGVYTPPSFNGDWKRQPKLA